jgi:hypothetical protein
LQEQCARSETGPWSIALAGHRLELPLLVLINGKQRKGLILKLQAAQEYGIPQNSPSDLLC